MNSLQMFNIAVKRNGLFFVFKMGRTSGNRFKLQQRRFRLNTRWGEIRLLLARTVKHLNMLPGEATEVFKRA